MSPRKRRREQAFSEEGVVVQAIRIDGNSDQPRMEKEQEAWDAVREAHYEAIEQLPLTLHRQLSLMRQLDEQTLSCVASLPSALQRYIKQRRIMAGLHANEEHPENLGGSHPSPYSSHHNETGTEPDSQTAASPSQISNAQMSYSSIESQNVLQEAPYIARELLSHVAFMAEELLRASQEKVNLAQANHDSVERHIRLLDQAIKEQEASLVTDHSRSSNGSIVHLPELVVPKWRSSRSIGRDGPDIVGEDNNALGLTGDYSTSLRQHTGKRTKGPSRGNEAFGQTYQEKKPSLTITLPAAQQNEELYCYCNRVSFGDMIACDSQSCDREWFHLGCVGLTEVPEGEWYCEDCRVDEF